MYETGENDHWGKEKDEDKRACREIDQPSSDIKETRPAHTVMFYYLDKRERVSTCHYTKDIDRYHVWI